MALSLPLPRASRPTGQTVRSIARAAGRSGWIALRSVVWPALWQGALFLAVFWVAMNPAVRMLPLPSVLEQDMGHFRLWIAWLSANGVEAAYAGIFPATYIIYPPLTPYFFHLVGQLLAAMPAPPEVLAPYWPADGNWFEALVRTPVVLFHGLLTALIYWSTLRWKGHLAAIGASVLYGANPAALFDLVYWAQPDSYHAFFAVAGLLLLLGRWPELGWAAMAIAALAKPQAWIYLPVLALVTWRRHGFGKVLSGGVFFIAAAVPLVWPFIVSDRGWELASVFVNFSRVMPVVTANAHNLWWILMGQDGLFTADTAIFIGPFNYQTVGLVLLLTGYSAALMKTLGDGDRETLFSAAGFMSLVFFLFATQIHENHAFLVFPMLAMCWPASARLFVVYLILTVTMFGNLALHDPILEPLLPQLIEQYRPVWLPASLAEWTTPEKLALLGSFLNFLALGIWFSTFVWRWRSRPVPARERQRRAGWGAFVGGSAAVVAAALALYLILVPPAPIDPAAPTDSILDGRVSLKPVEEPYLRITLGGGGTTDPDARRLQTIFTAIGGAAAVAFVSLGYASYQGFARGRG
ncbi:MAG: hypothetical protein U0556_12950 [Dehalococcoidia bacterium]